jgi:archaellum biogenesis ATPase FlaH
MEKQILSSMLANRGTHELFERIGSYEDFSPLGRTVAGAIREYYDLDPNVRSCSFDLIESRLLGRITNPKHEAPLREYLRGLSGDVSTANVERSIRDLHRKSVGGKLSLALANGAPEDEVSKLVAEYTRADAGNDPGGDAQDRLVDVLDTSDLTAEGGNDVEFIRMWPKALNDRLDGGALRGHHVLVFARPETGKTLFAINLCAGFLHQKLSVLYVGNEEPVADIRDRVRGRLLKITKAELRRDRVASADRLAKASLGTLRIAEGTTFAGVRDALKTFRADVVIFDQIRNMRLKSESRTAELEAAGIEARAIAKEYNALVVSITQAGDSATNKVYLEMSDVDSSKTGIPASADLMIGVGADEAMKLNGLLGLSLPKNKLSGIHDKFTVSANFATGVIE